MITGIFYGERCCGKTTLLNRMKQFYNFPLVIKGTKACTQKGEISENEFDIYTAGRIFDVILLDDSELLTNKDHIIKYAKQFNIDIFEFQTK